MSVLCSALFLAAVCACALAPGLIAPHDPQAQAPADGLLGPGGDHPLGTDQLGRDVLSRVVAGAASAIGGPILIALGAVGIATLLGLVAGYAGGRLDAALSRGADVLFALPELLIAIVVVGVVAGGYLAAVAVLIVLSIPATFRLIRAATLEQRVRPYVEATRTTNLGTPRILALHVLPNLLPLVSAALFLRFTYALAGLAGLSFIGLGVSPGSADWGRMLAENRLFLFENVWGALAPALMLILTAMSANLIGDWLFERFSARGRAR